MSIHYIASEMSILKILSERLSVSMCETKKKNISFSFVDFSKPARMQRDVVFNLSTEQKPLQEKIALFQEFLNCRFDHVGQVVHQNDGPVYKVI